jgi:lipid A 3-O-deacylase
MLKKLDVCRVLGLLSLGALLATTVDASSGAVAPPGNPSSEGAVIVASVGTFDVGGIGEVAGGGLRYRRPAWAWIHFTAGGTATSAGSRYAFAGLSLDVPVGRRLILRGSFAPGYYSPGRFGKDLGHSLEFRSAVELSVPLGGRRSIGIEYSHVSNAGLGSINPGQESLVVTLALPVGSAR